MTYSKSKLKISVIFWFTLLGLYSLSAQPNIQWQRSFGGSNSEQAFSVTPTRDRGYAVAGYTGSTDGDIFGHHGYLDYWVLKLDSTGNIVWKKPYGGSDLDQAYAIHQTTDNGYIMAGLSYSNNWDVSGNHGEGDFWVVKLNENGIIQWQKALGGSERDYCYDVKETADGGYIATGYTESSDGDVTASFGGRDYWVVKLDNLGNIAWQRTYGGSGLDMAWTIEVCSDGGYIVGGESSSTNGNVSNPIGESDFWIVKLNFEGKIEWEKSLGSNGVDQCQMVIEASNGGYVAIGYISSNTGQVTGHHGSNDCWAAKLDGNGNLLWQKALGGSSQDNCHGITKSVGGGYLLCGLTTSSDGDVIGNDGGADLWLVKINEDGELVWQKTIGGSMAEFGFDIQATPDGGYITVGYSWSNDGDVTENKGKTDFWVVKLSPETSTISEIVTQPLQISPNPALEHIDFSLPETDKNPVEVSIFSTSGQEIRRFTTSSTSVDVSGLPMGAYTLQARTKSGTVYIGRFLKQ